MYTLSTDYSAMVMGYQMNYAHLSEVLFQTKDGVKNIKKIHFLICSTHRSVLLLFHQCDWMLSYTFNSIVLLLGRWLLNNVKRILVFKGLIWSNILLFIQCIYKLLELGDFTISLVIVTHNLRCQKLYISCKLAFMVAL